MAAKKKAKMNVDVQKVDVKLVDAALAKLGRSRSGTKLVKIARLEEQFAGVPKEELLECTECGGDSSADFDACPFCGEGDDDEVGKAKTAQIKSAIKDAKKRNEAAPKRSSAPKKAAGKSTRALLKPASTAVVMPDEDEQAPARPTQFDPKMTVADLDAGVEKVQALKAAIVKNYYDLGHALKRLYDSEAWQLRLDDGKPRYTNWKSFCHEELTLSHVQSYRLMDTAATFNEAEIDEIGTTKLAFVLKVPEEYRDKLKEEARAGASTRELRARVEQIKGLKQGEKMPPPEPLPREERMAVAIMPGRKTLTLLARPTRKDAPPKPAKKLTDGPWAQVEMSNDVRAVYKLTKTRQGVLALIVEYHRISK